MKSKNYFRGLRKLAKSKAENPPVDDQETIYDVPEGSVLLADIECVDADGNIFEQYDRLWVAKDVERNEAGNHISFSSYKAISHFEKKGWFLPSMALSCNILAKLFDKAVRKKPNGSYETIDPKAKAVLDTYKNYSPDCGGRAQNTVIGYGSCGIIHYPVDSDFPSYGGKRKINSTKTRRILEFSKDGLHDSKLEDILNGLNPELTMFLKQFTGLRDPQKLVDIGRYFGNPAKLWFPWSGNRGKGFKETLSSWLGCNGDHQSYYNFILGGYCSLGFGCGASGAREP